MQKNKMIAPIGITAFIVLYYIGFGWVCLRLAGIPLFVKILGCVIPLFIIGVSLYVLVERIKEIRSGEEDDLSQY